MRGKRWVRGGLLSESGITPAGAGKTLDVRFLRAGTRDHPRRCGENSSSSSSITPLMGSPPQVRGKPLMLPQVRLERGITPAGAGKTTRAVRRAIVKWDHPRRCGENERKSKSHGQERGSPPQVRGKQPAQCRRAPHQGITPAGAGKTCDSVEVYGEL